MFSKFAHSHSLPFPHSNSHSHSRTQIIHCPFTFPWDSHGKNGKREFPLSMNTSTKKVKGQGQEDRLSGPTPLTVVSTRIGSGTFEVRRLNWSDHWISSVCWLAALSSPTCYPPSIAYSYKLLPLVTDWVCGTNTSRCELMLFGSRVSSRKITGNDLSLQVGAKVTWVSWCA